jgi:hypothetical protein
MVFKHIIEPAESPASAENTSLICRMELTSTRGPPSKSARTALMVTVTGWFWANGRSQQGLSGTGTRA